MRIVFVGASRLVMQTVRLLLGRNHDVVVIERNRENADMLTSSMGCGVILGDGSKPAILKEADPTGSDYLFCMTDNDQTNILASLVGRSLGFKHVVTRIDDPEFEHICIELGLENTIIPSRTISWYLADMVKGETSLALSGLIKNEAALFSFVVAEGDAMAVKDLSLPDDSRLMFLYREDSFILPNVETQLKVDDEVVMVCHRKRLNELRARWNLPKVGK
jgi:trk system potassium uptake protein TrkA